MGGMSGAFQPSLDFAAADTAAEDGEALIIDVDGYEGPLHVLLALARTQKVDLLKLSELKLHDLLPTRSIFERSSKVANSRPWTRWPDSRREPERNARLESRIR